MRSSSLKISVLIVLIAYFSLLFSTNNSLNIEKRTLVHAIGIDYNRYAGKYDLTLQVFKPQGAGADTPIDTSQANVQIVKGSGKSVSQALDRCQNEYGRELFMGHLQLIAFGKSVDFSEPRELFAFCLHDKNIYMGVKLCIAETKAEKLLETEITKGATSAENFVQAIDINTKNSVTLNCRLIDFLSCIDTPQYIAMPVLSIKEEKSKSENNPPSKESTASDPIIQIKETCLIKNGKILKDTLSSGEAMGAAWLTKSARKADISVKENKSEIDAAITKNKSKIYLTNENGRLVVNAHITVVAHPLKNITDKNEEIIFARRVEQKLTEYCKNSVEKALYQNQTDIFGIWKRIRHQYPQTYLDYKDKLDEIYAVTDFNIRFKCYVE